MEDFWLARSRKLAIGLLPECSECRPSCSKCAEVGPAFSISLDRKLARLRLPSTDRPLGEPEAMTRAGWCPAGRLMPGHARDTRTVRLFSNSTEVRQAQWGMLLDEAVSIGFRGLEGLAIAPVRHIAKVTRMDAVSSLDTHKPGMGTGGLVVDARNAVHTIAYPIGPDVARTFAGGCVSPGCISGSWIPNSPRLAHVTSASLKRKA